jgi:tRNA wybutosine-synthesizing protein 2
VRVLWGDGTDTVHIEAGVRYSLDVARVMFSPGNIDERVGIADRVRPGSVVVDLFSGIGYFALPIAVRRPDAYIHACELNPVSFAYLVRNIRLNRVSNVVPLLGDCREVAPCGVADWVLMGHFDGREYLDVAFSALRGKGTILYHELCPKEQYPDAMTCRLAAAARSNWRDVITIRTRIVKSYAPGILHVAAELQVRRQARG